MLHPWFLLIVASDLLLILTMHHVLFVLLYFIIATALNDEAVNDGAPLVYSMMIVLLGIELPSN